MNGADGKLTKERDDTSQEIDSKTRLPWLESWLPFQGLSLWSPLLVLLYVTPDSILESLPKEWQTRSWRIEKKEKNKISIGLLQSNFCRIFFQQDSLFFNHLLVIWFLCCCFSQCIQLYLFWTIFFLISLLSPTGHSLSFGIWWWIVVGRSQVWQKESKLLDLRRKEETEV